MIGRRHALHPRRRGRDVVEALHPRPQVLAVAGPKGHGDLRGGLVGPGGGDEPPGLAGPRLAPALSGEDVHVRHFRRPAGHRGAGRMPSPGGSREMWEGTAAEGRPSPAERATPRRSRSISCCTSGFNTDARRRGAPVRDRGPVLPAAIPSRVVVLCPCRTTTAGQPRCGPRSTANARSGSPRTTPAAASSSC